MAYTNFGSGGTYLIAGGLGDMGFTSWDVKGLIITWVKLTPYTDQYRSLFHGAAGVTTQYRRWNTSGGTMWGYEEDSTNQIKTVTRGVQGPWAPLGMIWNTNASRYIYCNGGSAQNTATLSGTINNLTTLYLGLDGVAITTVDVRIAEVSIWSIADAAEGIAIFDATHADQGGGERLNAAEVQASVGGNLLAYWPFTAEFEKTDVIGARVMGSAGVVQNDDDNPQVNQYVAPAVGGGGPLGQDFSHRWGW